jgi:hypothetical protein
MFCSRSTLTCSVAPWPSRDSSTQAQTAPGHLLNVLQVIAAPQCDMSVRQAGSIHFKQILTKGWDPKHGASRAFPAARGSLRRRARGAVRELS